jgi:adenosylmethionine-8-amino-7-oxononanoate aminotransferase
MTRPGRPDWSETGFPHIWLPYTQMKTAPRPLDVVATEGVRIRLADGRELIDGISSWWTACHGYNHPHIRNAVEAQLRKMPHVMLGGLVHEPGLRLARRLAALLPGNLNQVFFSESGSVSVEIAMKMAVQYWLNRGVSSRSGFIAFRHAYHGDTVGAMSVCDPEEGMHAMFAGVLPLQTIADLPRDAPGFAAFDALLAERADRTAAVILEPLLQAAGGMKFHAPDVLKRIADLCRKHDVLLILDEIATGFGRTGSMFACEQAGVCPDIVTLSKALTGGTLPLAATVATDGVYEGFLSDEPGHALMHGPTFTGNPTACAAANASLDLFEREPRLAQVAAIEAALADGLAPCREMPGVADVRCKGAIGVVQLDRVSDLNALRTAFVDQGVWVRPFGDVVYLMPPFVVSAEELATLTAAVVAVVAGWSRQFR